MLQLYNGILFAIKKKQNADLFFNMDEPYNIMLSTVLWPVTKGHMLCMISFVILHVITFYLMSRTGWCSSKECI